MELAKLRYFYVVAKHQHVTRAAEEIHIAQPALTKAIKSLEDELQVSLFYKKGRNVYLTAYGKYLQEKLQGIFAELDAIPQELKTLKGEQNRTVKLNVLSASTAVTDAVVAYKKKFPETVFELIQNEAEQDCQVSVSMNGGLSTALPPFEKRSVFSENVYLAVHKNSPYAQRESVALSEVAEEGFVSLAGSKWFRVACDKYCAMAGFKPKTAFESDSPVAVKNIIGASAGVGFWPEFSWGKTSGDLVLLPISSPNCARELVVGLHKTAISSAVAEDFYEYLVAFLQKRFKKEKRV